MDIIDKIKKELLKELSEDDSCSYLKGRYDLAQSLLDFIKYEQNMKITVMCPGDANNQ